MRKSDFNVKFRDYARTLSPRQYERDLISKIYQSICDLLGANNCIQIGSYPRFTAITPVHDLDVLYIIGRWDDNNHNPLAALQNLAARFNQYVNPTSYRVELGPAQSHSITILFKDSAGKEILSIDIVPTYIFSKNEFSEDTYKVPEIARKRHGKKRTQYYQELSLQHKEMGWIISDPRGYIHVASDADIATSGEFRKTAKVVKRWKNNLVAEDENLKLQSFHIEQVITNYFRENTSLEIFDAVFKFFIELPEIINNPNQIKDRANNGKFIDDYLEQFTNEQRNKIISARDGFLVKLENLGEYDSVDQLFAITFYSRKFTEEFLFDGKIPTFIDKDLKFRVDGFVKPLSGFTSGWLSETPHLQRGLTRGVTRQRHIEFRIRKNETLANEFRWKVRNSDNSMQPRGEITLHRTKSDPESTEYPGDHYVECYAIQNNVCIAKSKVPVKII